MQSADRDSKPGVGAKLLAFNPCDYYAGHRCRKCNVHISDHDYIASGLFLSLCPPCLASARQTVRELST